MLYLLNKDVRTVRWNGEPLHEATSAIVKETMNGDFTLTVKYPISDSGIYQLIQEDMLIKAPTPVLGAQLFRIKKPVENNDHLEITAYHISDDVMQRSITPMSVTSQSCGMALSRMVQNTKTALGNFSFNSDIQDRRTFNTTETETLYSVLLDGKHSIVGTWEGELVRDNFAMTIKKSRGENRGVVITTHKNLKDYQRTKNSQNVVTRIHAKSTFKPEGAEKETTIKVTVDSPLINSYPYINEKEYENNNAKTVEELQKWAQSKFTNQGIDKVSDAIKIEAYELDGQVVHMGDTVNLKSWKHNVDALKKAIAYEFDALKEEYISLTFDDKAGTGGSRASGGLSSAADAILGVTESAQEIALEKALQNADLDFDHKAGLLRQEISDGIELARARAEEVKKELSDNIDQRFNSFNNGPLQEAKRKAEEALRNAGASTLLAQEAKRIGLDSIAKLEAFKSQATSAQTTLSGAIDALKQTIANDIRPKQAQAEAEIAKQVEALIQTKNELTGIKSAQATYEETTTRRLAELANVADGKASKSELTQTAEELASKIASVKVGGRNLYALSKNYGIASSSHLTDLELDAFSGEISFRTTGTDPYVGIAASPPKQANDRDGILIPVLEEKQIYVTISNPLFIRNFISFFDKDKKSIKAYKRYKKSSFIISSEDLEGVAFISLCFGCGGTSFKIGDMIKTKIKIEYGTIPTDWSPAPEDQEERISIVESNFKQRADALDAGVSRLTEGLRTKADISALNVTAENIRQSVKSLETNTQNKLDQKLSQAEFEVRAGSIRQEILNATKDKADKTLVIAEAGKLREEFSNLSFSENLFINSEFKNLHDNGTSFVVNDSTYKNLIAPYWHNPYNSGLPNHQNIQHGHFDTDTFKETVFVFDESDGSRHHKSLSTGFEIGKISVGEYYFSTDLYATSQGTKIKFGFYYHKSTGRPGFYSGEKIIQVNEVGNWIRMGTRLTVNDDIDLSKEVLFYIYGYNFTSNSILYLKKPKISKGLIKTDWSPAPEDTDGLITEAKATFERTAQGLRTDLSAIQEYVNKDGQRQEALQSYAREESAKQATAVRELVTKDYVGKATYQETVRAIENKFEAITNPQNGSIATQIANYKKSVDGRFADITSLIAGKANQTDFQRVKETSQLYERILGNTENSIVDKVSRMALTNQLFQVELAKNVGAGHNYIKNADFRAGNKNWNESVKPGLNFNYNHSSSNRGKPGVHIYGATDAVYYGLQQRIKFEILEGDIFTVSFLISRDGASTYSGLNLGVHYRKNNEIISQKWVSIPNSDIPGFKYKKMSFSFVTPKDIDELNLMLYGEQGKTINLYISEVKLERGSFATDFTLSPEDIEEAIRTVQTQLAGSWSVQNINSAGDLISGINLGSNGQNRITGKLTHITGETLIDNAVIKSAMIDKLKTANFETGSVTTIVLDAEAVTADKVKMNEAFANKLVASDTFTDTLTAKRGFINQLVSNNIFTNGLTAQRGFIQKLVSNNIFTNELTAQRSFINQLQSKIINTETLDAFRGRIGGFNLGPFPQGGGRWIAGNNPYICGMGNGEGGGVRTAFWANWGSNWNQAGWGSWVVTTDGKMSCKNDVSFYHKADFSNTCTVNFYSKPNATRGIWTGDGEINGSGSNPGGGQNAVVWWNQITTGKWRQHAGITTASDRRLKENIEPTSVKALNKIKDLNLVAFDYIKDKSHEEIGLIAQEVSDIVPNAVSEYEGEDSHLTINYAKFIPYLLKAIQELNQKINLMEERYESII